MKKRIFTSLSELQQKSLGHIGMLSYQYSNLCVKADGSSLLSIEMEEDGISYHIEDLAHIIMHTEEGDDDKIDLIPKNGDDDIPMLSKGVMEAHPEFIQSVEEMEDENHMLRLTMPQVNDDRKKVLEDAVNLFHDECKAKMESVNTFYTTAIEVQLAGETKEVIDEVNENVKTIKDEFAKIREQYHTDKLQELEDAYRRYIASTEQSVAGSSTDGTPSKLGQSLKM